MRHAEKLDHHQPNRDLALHPLQEVTAAAVPHRPTTPYPPLIQKYDTVECAGSDLVPENWKEIWSQVDRKSTRLNSSHSR